MPFYTYAYIVQQTHMNNLFQFILIMIVLVAWIGISVKYMHNRMKSKYRDLSIILFLVGVFLCGANWDEYTKYRQNEENISQMTLFLSNFSDNITIDAHDLAVNSLRLQDGMIVKRGNDYFRIDFDTRFMAYRISRVYLVQKNIKIVDYP